MGDVVGRGLIAASAMGQLRSAVRALAGAGLGPAGVLEHLDTFVAQVPAAQYATVAYLEVDLSDGSTCLACAGHLPPLLLDGAAPPRVLMEGRSPPLGILLPGMKREQDAVTVPPGGGLLLYTDGLVERRGEAIDEGIDRLVGAVEALPGIGHAELVERLVAALLPETTDDDVCVLSFKRLEE
jgi:serine phosphatase RsbU (regulator of sigma subunit)